MLAQPLPKLQIENGYLYITNNFDGIYNFELVKNLRICQRGDDYIVTLMNIYSYFSELLLLSQTERERERDYLDNGDTHGLQILV